MRCRYSLPVHTFGGKLLGELCADLEEALKCEKRLVGYDLTVERTGADSWFSVDVTREGVWDELGVSLANWKADASQVALSVYNYGEPLNEVASEWVRGCLASKSRAWHQKRASELDLEHLAKRIQLERSAVSDARSLRKGDCDCGSGQ